MSNIKTFSFLSIILILSIPLHTQAKEKNNISHRLRICSIAWSTGKIGLGCYVLYRSLTNQLIEERTDAWYKQYWQPEATITQEFIDNVMLDTSFNLSSTDNYNITRLMIYWQKSDGIIHSQVKKLFCFMSSLLIITGMIDLYHTLNNTEQPKQKEETTTSSAPH